MRRNKIWSVYLLSNKKRTYIGCTTDPARRLRQHNREIVGGSRSTRSGAPNWKLVLHVEGFANRAEAMRWEAIAKRRARGIHDRMRALILISTGKCPMPKEKSVHYPVPNNLALIIGVAV